MSYELIRFDVDPDGVATLLLNRPEKRNAWNRQMGLEIRHALRDADARDDVRVVIVTGAGKAFCAGADLEGAGKVFDEPHGRGGRNRAPVAQGRDIGSPSPARSTARSRASARRCRSSGTSASRASRPASRSCS
jgi:enoyl-CoA hydratase/carnithine racemase